MLTIIRHSYRDDEVNKHLYKTINNNCPISEEGKKYAKEKALELQRIVKTVDKIYTSPFKRTIQTSKIFSNVFSSVFTPDIKVCYDLSEGQNKDAPDYEKELADKLKENGIKYPETNKHIKDRCIKTLNLIENELKNNKSVLLVTHGYIYNVLLTVLFDEYGFEDALFSKEYIPRCCDLSVLKYNNGEYDNKYKIVFSDVYNLNKLKI